MATETQEIQARDKQEVKGSSEPTTAGPVFSPAVDIFEDENAVTLVADMPGVPKETLNIDLHDDVLTITGVPGVGVPEGEQGLLQEFEIGKYLRKFTLADAIDQGRIEAKIANGVLRLTLPKAAPAKPRRIQVTEG